MANTETELWKDATLCIWHEHVYKEPNLRHQDPIMVNDKKTREQRKMTKAPVTTYLSTNCPLVIVIETDQISGRRMFLRDPWNQELFCHNGCSPWHHIVIIAMLEDWPSGVNGMSQTDTAFISVLTVVSKDWLPKTDTVPFRFGEEDILRCIFEEELDLVC